MTTVSWISHAPGFLFSCFSTTCSLSFHALDSAFECTLKRYGKSFFCADIWRNSCIIKRPSLLIANGPPTSLSIMLRQVPALFGGIHLPLLSSRRRLLACRLSVGLPATEGRLLAAATHRVLQTANASQCALSIYIHTNLYIPVNRRRRAFSHGKKHAGAAAVPQCSAVHCRAIR